MSHNPHKTSSSRSSGTMGWKKLRGAVFVWHASGAAWVTDSLCLELTANFAWKVS